MIKFDNDSSFQFIENDFQSNAFEAFLKGSNMSLLEKLQNQQKISTEESEHFDTSSVCPDCGSDSGFEYDSTNSFGKPTSSNSPLVQTSSKSILEINLEKEVQAEMSNDIDGLLEDCLRSTECKDEEKNKQKIRYKQTKSPFQLKLLNNTLIEFPNEFPRKERIKLEKAIGLTEVQIYKWWYDNNPLKANKAEEVREKKALRKMKAQRNMNRGGL